MRNVTDRRRRSVGGDDFLKMVGARVRQLRRNTMMSRKDLSYKAGVSERYLHELENGAGNASLLVVRDIAQAIGVPIDMLVGE